MAKPYVRLTQPLVRDTKGGELRPATWDEALDRAAAGLRAAKAAHGPDDIRDSSAARRRPTRSTSRPRSSPGGPGQQQHRQLQPDLTRPSVAGLATVFGAGGGTSSYQEVEETDLIVLWGTNARETHPIFFHHLLKGVHNGARLYAVDPRRTGSARVGGRAGSASTSAATSRWPTPSAREIIAAGLENREFIERATDGFEAYKAKVEPYTLEYAERETGVPADAIRELAHAYATADRAMICWTLGITEHHNAVDNVLALINLALLTGHVGRYGSGAQPAARPEQRPGRRRHGRAAGSAARLPARRERRAAGEVRRAWGVHGAAEARLAPVRDVRRDGARRPDGALRHRREPDPVGGRPAPRRSTARAASISSSSRTSS